MVTMSQARELIWTAITDAGGPQAVSDRTRGADGAPAVSMSMIYKFKPLKSVGGAAARSRLGRESVTALSAVLPGVKPETWLAAMGVEYSVVPAADAAAQP